MRFCFLSVLLWSGIFFNHSLICILFFQWVTSRSRSACGSVSGARDRRGQTGKLGDSPQSKPAQRLLLLLFRHRAKFIERNAAHVVQHRVEVFNQRYKTFWGVKLTVFGPSCSQGFFFFWWTLTTTKQRKESCCCCCSLCFDPAPFFSWQDRRGIRASLKTQRSEKRSQE